MTLFTIGIFPFPGLSTYSNLSLRKAGPWAAVHSPILENLKLVVPGSSDVRICYIPFGLCCGRAQPCFIFISICYIRTKNSVYRAANVFFFSRLRNNMYLQHINQ